MGLGWVFGGGWGVGNWVIKGLVGIGMELGWDFDVDWIGQGRVGVGSGMDKVSIVLCHYISILLYAVIFPIFRLSLKSFKEIWQRRLWLKRGRLADGKG